MDSKQGPPPNYNQAQAGMPQQHPYPQGQPMPQPGAYPPPAGGYPAGGYPQSPHQGYAQPTSQSTTVVINQPVAANMSEVPVTMICTQCRANITTRVVYTNGMLVWIICLVLLLFGCWLGCCLIPFCMDSVKDVEHYCPSCNCLLGVKKRL